MIKFIVIILVILVILNVAYFIFIKKSDIKQAPTTQNAIKTKQSAPEVIMPETKNEINVPSIILKTNLGEIEFTTYHKDAPKTTQNFIDLTNKGFYDGIIFHRVIKGFMIQGGDPTGTGSGGPGYKFEDELNPETDSYKAGYKKGVVAMANSGPNTNGSQFFIMHEDYPLEHNYTIFGKVIRGQDVVDKIANSKTDSSDKPLEKIIIEKATVIK